MWPRQSYYCNCTVIFKPVNVPVSRTSSLTHQLRVCSAPISSIPVTTRFYTAKGLLSPSRGRPLIDNVGSGCNAKKGPKISDIETLKHIILQHSVAQWNTVWTYCIYSYLGYRHVFINRHTLRKYFCNASWIWIEVNVNSSNKIVVMMWHQVNNVTVHQLWVRVSINVVKTSCTWVRLWLEHHGALQAKSRPRSSSLDYLNLWMSTQKPPGDHSEPSGTCFCLLVNIYFDR